MTNFTFRCNRRNVHLNRVVVQGCQTNKIQSLLEDINKADSHDELCELCEEVPENIEHILLARCPLLLDRKEALVHYSRTILEQSQTAYNCFESIMNSEEDERVLNFLLNCSNMPDVCLAAGEDSVALPLLIKITQNWCYSLLRTRLKILGKWN